jgi:hypothetical protein
MHLAARFLLFTAISGTFALYFPFSLSSWRLSKVFLSSLNRTQIFSSLHRGDSEWLGQGLHGMSSCLNGRGWPNELKTVTKTEEYIVALVASTSVPVLVLVHYH